MMMMMMKNPIFLVTCILLFSSLAVLASDNSFGPDECCFQFYTKQLPEKRVVSYRYTDKRCSTQNAVLLKMKKGGVFCVNPSEQWVKDIIEAKEWDHTKPVNSPVTTKPF